MSYVCTYLGSSWVVDVIMTVGATGVEGHHKHDNSPIMINLFVLFDRSCYQARCAEE